MRALHPEEPELPCSLPPAEDTLAFELTDEGSRERLSYLRKAVFSFPDYSATGPSGLRPDHLNDLLGYDAGAEGHHLLEALDVFIRRDLTAGLPQRAVPVFCAARLTPLRKPDPAGGPDGTRPIAAGEVPHEAPHCRQGSEGPGPTSVWRRGAQCLPAPLHGHTTPCCRARRRSRSRVSSFVVVNYSSKLKILNTAARG